MNNLYRPEIDGLRAIAVLAVVGYHAFPALLPGGFIGVDVFFVISGYLITRILLDESTSLVSSISRFYTRRILRIFPALILVLMSCFLLGWYTLLAAEYKQLGKHILAGAGFFSNFTLWFEAGYFDNVSEAKPLLHLWSLGIEEQFYIIWPLILLGALRNRQQQSVQVMASILIASLLFACVVVYSDRTQAFYSPLSRAWELMAGALLGYRQSRHPGSLRCLEHRAMPVLGVALIVIAVFLIHPSYLFPGALALLPVVGASLVIGSSQSASMGARFLAHPALVNIGLISYPLYLWHWPLISFATIFESGQSSAGTRLLLVSTSFALATLTYHLIEKPVRRIPRRLAIVLLVILMGLIGFLGKNIDDRDGLERVRHKGMISLSEEARQDFVDFEKKGLIPNTKCERPFQFPGQEFCLTTHPERSPSAALIGDSHALHAYWGLSKAFDDKGDNLILLGRGACVPFFDYVRGRDEDGCQPHINKTMNNVVADPYIKTVVFVFRGRYLSEQSSPATVRMFREGLKQTLRKLQSAGKVVYYFMPVIEPGFDPRLCLGELPLGRKPPFSCDISRDEDDKKSAFLRKTALEVLSSYPAVRVLDPNDGLCVNGICKILSDGHTIFKDDNHLSYFGSMRSGKTILTN